MLRYPMCTLLLARSVAHAATSLRVSSKGLAVGDGAVKAADADGLTFRMGLLRCQASIAYNGCRHIPTVIYVASALAYCVR